METVMVQISREDISANLNRKRVHSEQDSSHTLDSDTLQSICKRTKTSHVAEEQIEFVKPLKRPQIGYSLWEQKEGHLVMTNVNEALRELLGYPETEKCSFSHIVKGHSKKTNVGVILTSRGIVSCPMKIIQVTQSSFVMQVVVNR